MTAILIVAGFGIAGWVALGPLLKAMHSEEVDQEEWTTLQKVRLIAPVVLFFITLFGFFAYVTLH